MDSDSEYSDFEGFSESDITENEVVEVDVGSDISCSPVSTPEMSEISYFESDDDLDATDPPPAQWTSNIVSIEVNPFQESVGLNFELGSDKNELDFFQQFFPESLFEKMTQETNKYAQKKIAEKADPKWHETTVPEMKAVMGIYIILSIMQIPRYAIAWMKKLYFGIPGIPEIMTRMRFESITKYFHLNDTSANPPKGQAGHDKLCHVRPFLDSVLSKCLHNYKPPKNQSIDEGMIGFKGRLSFKQYLPAKLTKFGIKVWERAHPQTGYVHEFQVYVGKPEGAHGRVAEEGLGSRVVKDLTAKIKGKNHHIYMDNYFSSPKLFEELKADGLYACGTVRCNRKGLPEAVKKPKDLKQRGDMKVLQKDSMVCVAWKDKKIVHLLYNNMDPTQQCTVIRREKDGSHKEINCPLVADIYSKNKGGVDIADQNRMLYTTCRKAKKWWKYLFWFLVDTSVCNALICMKESPNHQIKTKSGKKKTRKQLEFWMNLAKQLISGFRGIRKRKTLSNEDPDGHRHWPGRFAKRGRCKMCSKNGRRHEVYLGCKQCNIHLCVDNDCFEKYHKELWN